MKHMTLLPACILATVLAWPSLAGADPPPWAPAHGYRAKHQYLYYPSRRIYYEPARSLWFWLDAGNWRVGASLPDRLSRYATRGVSIELDTDRPYERQSWVDEHYGHHAHGDPGQGKPHPSKKH